MASASDENVIVIDDSSGDEEEKPSAATEKTDPAPAPPPPPSQSDDDDDDVIMIEPDEPEAPKSVQAIADGALKSLTSEITVSKVPIDPVSKASAEVSVPKVPDEVNITAVPVEVTVSQMPEVIDVDTIDDSDTLDFSELRAALELASDQHYKYRKGRGPVCCNSWCDQSAANIPEEHIRDYYNIPTGSTLCDDCIDAYYKYMRIAEGNLETNGDMLEGRCRRFNEFIILEDDSEEEDEATDPELERLLGNAIRESLKELDAEYNFQKTFDTTRTQLIERLNTYATEGAQLAAKIHHIEQDLFGSSESFKNAFRPKILELAELDIPLEVTTSGMPQTDSEDLMPEGVEPPSLPPYGELKNPPPKIGDTFYVMKEYQTAEWIPFKIADILCETNENGNFVESFTVETTVNGFMYRRIVSGDQIAYCNVSRSRLGIGSRVLGAFNSNGDQKKKRLFLSGMIAELPTSLNNFRYLVFFDDGKVQYCPHEDLREVYQCSKKIHEYFSGFNVEFVQSYLNKFPERAMVKTNPDHFVRVELNGFWISGKVDMLDGSLARVTFSSDQRSEWIYRGSPRLRPVFEKIQADLRNPLTKALPVIKTLPPRTMGPKSKMNVNQDLSNLQIVIDSSDDDEEAGQSRAVAKKSTARPVVPAPPPRFSQMIHRRPEKRVTRSSVIRRLPLIMLTPNTFRWHKCSFACVTWVQYSEDKTKGVNPLAIPSIFAFRREIDVTSLVSYTAPCGKRLKNIQEVLKYLSETLIPLTLDMFDFDIRTQIFDEFIVAPQYVLIEDISYGEERNPIPCVNDVDNQCPDLMNYMTVRRPQEGVHINLDPEFLVCCDCTDNCRDRSKCRCWRLTIDNFKPFNAGDDKRHITKIGYQYQRLDKNILSGIYECNSQCRCNTVTCINRVVQHPTRHKLQLFKTPRKGWGTRCVNDIPQGVFITTYVGNILTEPKANETGTINGDEYFAELDHIEVMEASKADFEKEAPEMTDEEDEESAGETPEPQQQDARRARRSCTLRKRKHKPTAPAKPSKPARVEEDSDSDSDVNSVRKMYGPNETVYVMDAKIAGNIGRYFNHSCDPNIFVQNVYVDTHDLRFPWVAFFALRHIPAGAELTWDYGYKIGSVPGKVLYCYCGSTNCRRRLL